jgi:hypothetical protein
MEIDHINKYCHVSAYIAYDNCSPVYKQTPNISELEQNVLLLNLGCSSNVQCNQQLLETCHQEYLYMSCQTSL